MELNYKSEAEKLKREIEKLNSIIEKLEEENRKLINEKNDLIEKLENKERLESLIENLSKSMLESLKMKKQDYKQVYEFFNCHIKKAFACRCFAKRRSSYACFIKGF
ncbi:MAG: hypothetical protein ACK4FY_05595 [Aquificaceae bacterium]